MQDSVAVLPPTIVVAFLLTIRALDVDVVEA